MHTTSHHLTRRNDEFAQLIASGNKMSLQELLRFGMSPFRFLRTERNDFDIMFDLVQAKRMLIVIFEFFARNISVFEYFKRFYCFRANTVWNNYNNIFLKILGTMFDIPKCDVIYYVSYLHYDRKAISPLRLDQLILLLLKIILIFFYGGIEVKPIYKLYNPRWGVVNLSHDLFFILWYYIKHFFFCMQRNMFYDGIVSEIKL